MVGANSYEIDSNATSITVFTPSAGRRFACLYLGLEAEADGSVQVQSGTTDICGPINLKTASSLYQIENSPFPVFLGRAAGEAMKIANAGTVQLNGTALCFEWEVRA